MTPNTTNGGRPSRGLLPSNAKAPTEGNGGYSGDGYVPTPTSRSGTGRMPPTVTQAGSVPDTIRVGDWGEGGGRGGTPRRQPGIWPAQGGAPSSPARYTPPTDKSKNSGAE